MHREFEYFVNLDERGEFFADVRVDGETVYEIHGFDIFEDGFMSCKYDIDGLESLLRTHQIMSGKDSLVTAN